VLISAKSTLIDLTMWRLTRHSKFRLFGAAN